MKITKYHQSTLLVETNKKRILIDPSSISYSEDLFENEWVNIDIILVTHKHLDHCNVDAINKIISRDNSKFYTSSEVVNAYSFVNSMIVKEKDKLILDDLVIEVTKATHGYMTGMRENNNEIRENIGFIIDDGSKRLYTTSDTINFYNDYKCNILCMPFNGNGLTLGLVDGIGFIKGINPEIVLPIHMQHPNTTMNPNVEDLVQALEENDIKYKILEFCNSIEI